MESDRYRFAINRSGVRSPLAPPRFFAGMISQAGGRLKNIEETIAKAKRDFYGGYNCAQTVLLQFCTDYSLAPESALRLASGFGGGMAVGKTCGALSGAIMVLGIACGFSDQGLTAEGKQSFRSLVQELNERFCQMHGSPDCTDLLGLDLNQPGNRDIARELNLPETHCARYIESSIRLLKEMLRQDNG